MTTKIKTIVTFTFSFTSTDEKSAISNLLDWMSEHQNEHPEVTRNCESGEYTITDEHSISHSFKFKTAAELARKYAAYFSTYDLARAIVDYANIESVTATSEDIEVEEGK